MRRERTELYAWDGGQLEIVDKIELLISEHICPIMIITLPYFKNQNMQHHANCPHSHSITISKQTNLQAKKIAFVVDILLEHFISPHKVLYLLDPVQADKFKARNEGKGCCASHKITIPPASLTQNQKWLVELTHPTYLANHLSQILRMCSEKHRNIIEKGKQDKLEINDQVDKFVMDKVLAQCANHYIFQQLATKARDSGLAVNREIGLWATPASWLQKYPHSPLQFLPSATLGELLGKGWAVTKNFFASTTSLLKELEMLEKDCKFEEKSWIQSGKSKILANPQAYAQLKGSQDRYLFEGVRDAALVLSSIPFELNLKANIFCTVSPNLHVCFSTSPCQNKSAAKGQLRFTVVMLVSSACSAEIGSSQVQLSSGDLLIIDNEKYAHRLSCSSNESLFLLRNFIGVASQK